MSASIAGGITTFIATSTIYAGRRVKYDGNRRVSMAGVNDAEIGVSVTDTGKTSYAAGEAVGVVLNIHPGTVFIETAGAISDGGAVKRAADGKVASDGAGDSYGIALQAAAGENELIEVLRDPEVQITPAAESVNVAALADALAEHMFSTTVAVANTGSPDGVAHVTGQVQDVKDNAVTGRFLIALYFDDAAYGDPADLGEVTAAVNSRILKELTDDAFVTVLTHTDGSWGVALDTATDGTVHAHATVIGKFAADSEAITGNE